MVGAVAARGADDEHGLALAAARSHGGNEDDGSLDFHFYGQEVSAVGSLPSSLQLCWTY